MKIFNAISTGLSKGTAALIKAGKTTIQFTVSFTSQGFADAARMTIDSKTEKVTIKDRLLAKLILGVVTYVPGFVVGLTIGPVAYFIYKNFTPFANFTNDKLNEYTDIKSNSPAPVLKYEGGPLYVYGLFGAFLGLTLGTLFYTIPKILFYKIPSETFASISVWFENGIKIAESDKATFINTVNNRRFLSKIFGYIPIGIPLSIIAFILPVSIITIIRFGIETFKSIYNNSVRGWNLAFFDKTAMQADIYDLRTFYERFLGIPGLIIGLCTGALVWAATTVIRSIINSGYNFYKWATIGFSLPIIDLKGTEEIAHKFKLEYSSLRNFLKSIKLSYAENVLGAPGYLLAPVALFLGFISGSALRIALESFNRTLDTMIVLIAHIALRGRKNAAGVKYEETPRVENLSKYSPLIGFLGYPVGLIISTLPVAIIGIVRYGATNIDSGRRVFNYIAASVLPGEEKFNEDKRPGLVKFLSAPGASVGLILGSTVRITAESYRSFINTGKLWIKTSLTSAPTKIVDAKYLQIKNPDRTNPSRAFGALGYILGAMISTPLVISIFIARLALTNADSAKRDFANTVNPNLTAKSKITLTNDERTEILKTAGYPGSMLGKVAGFLGLVSIESAVYFEYIFKKSTLLALSQMESAMVENITPPDLENRKIWLGLPGVLFGTIVGGISFVIAGSGRVLFNTAQTIYHVTLDMVKFVRSKDKIPPITDFAELTRLTNFDYQPLALEDNDYSPHLHQTIITTPATRKDKRKTIPFRLGLLGLPIGGVIGTIAAFTVGFFRIIKATMIRTFNNGLYYSRLALPKDKQYDLNIFQVKQEPIDKILGSLGIILGVPVGTIGFISLGTIRVIVDTIISISVSIIKIANLPPVNYSPDFNDKRSITDKILGSLGTIIGLPLGLAAYVLRISVNVIYNTYATARRDIINIRLWAEGDDFSDHILGCGPNKKLMTIKPSRRTLFEQHGFGFAGHIIGGAIGVALGVMIISLRVVWHNIKSILLAFQNTGNFVKTKKWDFADKYEYNEYVSDIQILKHASITVPHILKYLVGLPGIIVGSVLAGTFVIAPYYAKEFIKNNYLSYVHLSKSLINVGLEEFYFDGGVAADKRPRRYKIAGIFGYTLSLLTVGLLPVAHNLLKGLALVIGVVAFVPVATYKALKILAYPRFKGTNNSDQKIQKIKNIYSSLENGELVNDIKPNQTGRKGFWDFMRKAATFNLNTVTEDILEAELEYAKNPGFEIGNKIEEIKKDQHASHLFFTKEVRLRRDTEDNDTVECIRDKIEKHIVGYDYYSAKIPNIKNRSYYSLFFHSKDEGENNYSTIFDDINYNV